MKRDSDGLYRRFCRYCEALLSLCCARSPLGEQLYRAEIGVSGESSGAGHIEDSLIRVVDFGLQIRGVSDEDKRVLAVYYLGHSLHQVTDPTGQVVDSWVSGLDHAAAAKLLGLKGRNPRKTAMNRLSRALRHLPAAVAFDFFYSQAIFSY
jgi:hypothetical protein